MTRFSRISASIVTATATATAVLGLASHANAQAEDYPTQPITIIVPFSAGGTTDILARTIADRLGPALDATVVVENRPGAGGTLGTTLAAQAEPDGYTLFLAQVSSHGIAPNLYPDLQYDPVEDFDPIIYIASIPNIMVVNPELPVETVDEFIAYAKEHPGEVNFASSGIGTSIHLSGEMFKDMAGIDMVHVPYAGSAPAVTALIAGQVDVMFDNMPSAFPQVQSGQLRALAVTTAERSESAPDIPTVAEAATAVDLSDFEATSWFALFAPEGTPEPIIEELNTAVNEILDNPEVVTLLSDLGATPQGGTPADLAQHVEAELAKWKQVIEDAGVTMNQ